MDRRLELLPALSLFLSLASPALAAPEFPKSNAGTVAGTNLFERYLCLDGNGDYATVADDPSLDLGTGTNDDFTIETFFYVPDLTNSTIDGMIWKDRSFGVWIAYNATVAGGADRVVFRIWTDAFNYVTFFGDTSIGVGWHHIAAVWDNEYTASQDHVAVYVDGGRVISSTALEMTPGLVNSTDPVFIGTAWPFQPTAGWFEETRLSSVARYTGSSIAVPGAPFSSDPQTRALWHFNEAAGATSFADSSAYGNTANAAGDAQTCEAADCPIIVVSPPTLPNGAAGEAYSETLSASGGSEPYTFTVTAGALPSGLTLGSEGVLSGTPETAGSYDFTVTATDAVVCTGTQDYTLVVAEGPPLPAPTLFSATASSESNIVLNWTAVDGASGYEIERTTSVIIAFAPYASIAGTSYDDGAVDGGTTYLYRVRAVAGTRKSDFTPVDAATTVIFTDADLTSAIIKALHFTQLRIAVDAMREAAYLGPASYTNGSITTGMVITRTDLVELRTALSEAAAAIGLPAPTFNETIVAQSTAIKATHVLEIRAGTQ